MSRYRIWTCYLSDGMSRTMSNPETAAELQAEMSRQCPDCNLNWWLFPPSHVHGLPMVRCIECKRVYDEDVTNDEH